jgi:hypothetical protein
LSHQSGSRAIAARERGDAQLFGQSRTLRVKQLLGLNCSMANLDLAAPSAAILPNLRFSCLFAGLQAQLEPVAEIVPNSQPILISHDKRLRCRRLRVFRTAAVDFPLTAGKRSAVHNLKAAKNFGFSTFVRIPTTLAACCRSYRQG